MTPRVTLPPRSSSSRSSTVLIGTAKPMPEFAARSLMMDVFIPMTSPRMFSSGPPELPGLIAASVCSISLVRPGTGRSGRASAEMTPTVTVWLSPKGAPIAITQSPGAIRLESPNLAAGSFRSGRSTGSSRAQSVSRSRPSTRAS